MENQKNRRRPSGFATAGQTRKSGPALETKQKNTSEHGEKKAPKQRKAGAARPRRALKLLAAIVAALLVVFIIIVLAFGGNNTVHQMPTIERRPVSSTQENAPLSGAEVS